MLSVITSTARASEVITDSIHHARLAFVFVGTMDHVFGPNEERRVFTAGVGIY